MKCANCGVSITKGKVCPALCEPVPKPLPKYKGPEWIGLTHMSRLGAPVYIADGNWIGAKSDDA